MATKSWNANAVFLNSKLITNLTILVLVDEDKVLYVFMFLNTCAVLINNQSKSP